MPAKKPDGVLKEFVPQDSEYARRELAHILESRIRQLTLSVRAAADAAGISHSHLAKIIRADAAIPTPQVLDRLAFGLRIPYCRVFGAAQYLHRGQPSSFVSLCLSALEADYEAVLRHYLDAEAVYFTELHHKKAAQTEFSYQDAYRIVSEAGRAFIETKDPLSWLPVLLEANLVPSRFPAAVDFLIFLLSVRGIGLDDPAQYDDIFFLLEMIPEHFFSPDFAPHFAASLHARRKALNEAVVQAAAAKTLVKEAGKEMPFERMCEILYSTYAKHRDAALADEEAKRLHQAAKRAQTDEEETETVRHLLSAFTHELLLQLKPWLQTETRRTVPPSEPSFTVAETGEWTIITITLPSKTASQVIQEIAAIYTKARAGIPSGGLPQ
jgi:transcriptional regulator with XRE-family HTH domain